MWLSFGSLRNKAKLPAVMSMDFTENDPQQNALSTKDRRAAGAAKGLIKWKGDRVCAGPTWKDSRWESLIVGPWHFIARTYWAKDKAITKIHSKVVDPYLGGDYTIQVNKAGRRYLPHRVAINKEKSGKPRVAFGCAARYHEEYLYKRLARKSI